MSDTVAGYQATTIAGAGTSLITEFPSVLHSLWQPAGTAAGTVDFYDTNSTSGTASTNKRFQKAYISGGGVENLDYQFKKGIVAVTSGAGTLVVSNG
jgi:hypothetical protein